MDCRVVVEAAVPVYDVATPDEAIRIAVSKTGEMLNPDLNYVEIDMGSRTSPGGEQLPPAFVAADEALVALELEMTVFNVEQEEHASRIARKEIGQRLEKVPLKVLRVVELDEDGEPVDGAAAATEPEPASSTTAGGGGDGGSRTETGTDPNTDADDLLPEFEDLVEETSE
jgi:uncharacterized protein (UPF0212 family)